MRFAVWTLIVAGCSERPYDADLGVVDFSSLPDGTFPEGGGVGVISPATIEAEQGFLGGRLVELYDFGVHLPDPGTTNARVHPMWVFEDADGTPLHGIVQEADRSASRWVGQAPIVDVLPHHDGYSPIFEVVRVHLSGSVDPAAVSALGDGRARLPACRLDEPQARCRADDPSADPYLSEDCGGDPCVFGYCRSACASDEVCGGGGLGCSEVRFTRGARAGTGERVCVESLCNEDDDCEEGSGCVGGLCRPLVSEHCGADERCVDERCVPPCAGDGDCAIGQRCFRGFCEEWECDVSSQCRGGEICLDGICRAPIAAGGYRIDDVKSRETLLGTSFDLERTGQLVFCPIVDVGTTLAAGLTARDSVTPRIPLWFRGMRTACLLVDGGEALVPGGLPALSGDAESIPAGSALQVGATISGEFLPGDDAPWILDRGPGEEGYTPFVRVRRVEVPPTYDFGGFDRAEAVDPAIVSSFDPERFHAIGARGVVPACNENADCADTVLAEVPAGCSDLPGGGDPCTFKKLKPLECNPDHDPVVPLDPALPGFCDLPPVGVGAPCDGSHGRCDPEAGVTGEGLVCLGFCYEGCDRNLTDDDPDPDADSRCASAPGYRCFRLNWEEEPSGVCLKLCDSGGDPVLACESPTCGNGTLETGEACDFDPVDEAEIDTCNDTCSIDTSEEEPLTEALPDDHQIECSFGYCFYPDSRAQ